MHEAVPAARLVRLHDRPVLGAALIGLDELGVPRGAQPNVDCDGSFERRQRWARLLFDDLRGNAGRRRADEPRSPLFEGAGATKRDLVEYLDAVRDRICPSWRMTALGDPGASRPGGLHAEERAALHAGLRAHGPPLVGELAARRGLRAVQRSAHAHLVREPASGGYHPTLVRAERLESPTHLVIDLDPPDDGAFDMAARAAHLVRTALADVGLVGAVKTSGSKGAHVYVPVDGQPSMADALPRRAPSPSARPGSTRRSRRRPS